uniref:purple acid phosphatase family protein n=1 Tax=uncultured Cyclobacterium sp. TaxID=453820 RepID=UPI0030ED4373
MKLRSKKALIFICFLSLLGLFVGPLSAQEEPSGIYLTWEKDPTSTMTIDWHLKTNTTQTLFYRKKGEEDWRKKSGQVTNFPFSDRKIHRVFLSGLMADQAYEVKFGSHERVYYFKTMPKEISRNPIKFAIGGDTMHDQKVMEKTNLQVLPYNPDFIIIGGDLAYANGDGKNVKKWYAWFEAVKNTLIQEDGRMIPIMVGIGNHEVKSGFDEESIPENLKVEKRKESAPFYYNLFAFPGQPGYGVLEFGNYLSFLFLDSDHTNAIDGPQKDWLARELALQKEKNTSHVMAIYHVPAYPSARSFTGTTQTMIRNHWVPLFEKSSMNLAFENHDHAYKRTYPIKDNNVDEDGIVYIGDGSWGTKPRTVHEAASTWYLETSQSVRAFTLVTLQGKSFNIITVDEDGNIIDSYPNNPLI